MPSHSQFSAKYRADVSAYKKVRGDYEKLASIMEQVLKRATHELGLEAIVQVRAKELASFAEKSIRKQADYADPVNMMNDLCGARIITESTNDIGPVCAFIRKHFDVDEASTEDTAGRLGISEFGYRSVHFTVALKPGALEEDIAAVLGRGRTASLVKSRLLDRRTPSECTGKPFGPGPRYRAEIQVRSLLQHAWANLYHDRVYKSEFQLPADFKRGLMRIAAILEDADEQFAHAIQTIDGYREYYGAYLSRDQLKEELEKLREVRTFDSNNLKLALKIARIAVSLERWPEVVEVLSDFVAQWEGNTVTIDGVETTGGAALDDTMAGVERAETAAKRRRALVAVADRRDRKAANLLLDFGTAQWRCGEKAVARLCLLRATGLDLESADALIALADTYDEERNLMEALGFYRNAFEVNPLEPRAVRGYLQLTAEETHNLDFVAPMRPTLHNAIQRCRQRAALGIYLPWAYFDIGCFYLLLGESYEGIEAYAKAVELSHSATPIDASLNRARRLCQALRNTETKEWSLLERFLLVAKVGKLYRLADAAAAAVRAREEELVKAKQESTDTAWSDLEARRAEVQALRATADALRAEVAPTVASGHCPVLRGKVVIVAGGCAPGDEQRLSEYAPMLRQGFRDFAGTLFSGGTCSGIAQMVGDLPDSSRGPILKVTCLPEAMPTDHERHKGYEYYTHPGQGFSPLGAVQVWADILNQGVVPSSVRVIGISGGRLAGFEYRLALTMGAKVGVLKGSGRAADAILDDPEWMDHPNLIALPYDPQTVKLFVSGFSSGVLTEAQREEAARLNHERNVEKRQRKSDQAVPPENQPWDTLRPDLKASILERVDLIAEQLNAVGLRAVKLEPLPSWVTPIDEFTREQIETMAEMEHGRWCVRKFLEGWRWGERKDDKAKTHHDLIAWSGLDEPKRDKDRHYARQIPDLLREQGFAIVPAEAAGEMASGGAQDA